MQENAQTIYRQTIKPLTGGEKLRLAQMILQDLAEEEENGTRTEMSALDLLESLSAPQARVFDSARAVDEHLSKERQEAWDD